MRKLLVAGCLACCAFEGLISQELPSERKILMTSPNDIMILRDGSQLFGKLKSLPPLHYSFGTVVLDPATVVGVAIIHSSGQSKIEYIMKGGETFIGPFSPDDLFLFSVGNAEDSIGDSIDAAEKLQRFSPEDINLIAIGKKNKDDPLSDQKKFSLQFKSADQIPILFKGSHILLTDGFLDSILLIEKVDALYFNGGLQGKIMNGSERSDLNFSFVKERCFDVEIPYAHLVVRLPWEQIDSIACSKTLASVNQQKVAVQEQVAQREAFRSYFSTLDILGALDTLFTANLWAEGEDETEHFNQKDPNEEEDSVDSRYNATETEPNILDAI